MKRFICFPALMIIIASALFLLACQKEDEISKIDLLAGTWSYRYVTNSINYKTSYTFKTNGTMESSVIVLEPVTSTVLGYRSYQTANYTIKNDTLIIDSIKAYTASQATGTYYLPKNELTPVTKPKEPYTYILKENNTQLFLRAICGQKQFQLCIEHALKKEN